MFVDLKSFTKNRFLDDDLKGSRMYNVYLHYLKNKKDVSNVARLF